MTRNIITPPMQPPSDKLCLGTSNRLRKQTFGIQSCFDTTRRYIMREKNRSPGHPTPQPSLFFT